MNEKNPWYINSYKLWNGYNLILSNMEWSRFLSNNVFWVDIQVIPDKKYTESHVYFDESLNMVSKHLIHAFRGKLAVKQYF